MREQATLHLTGFLPRYPYLGFESAAMPKRPARKQYSCNEPVQCSPDVMPEMSPCSGPAEDDVMSVAERSESCSSVVINFCEPDQCFEAAAALQDIEMARNRSSAASRATHCPDYLDDTHTPCNSSFPNTQYSDTCGNDNTTSALLPSPVSAGTHRRSHTHGAASPAGPTVSGTAHSAHSRSRTLEQSSTGAAVVRSNPLGWLGVSRDDCETPSPLVLEQMVEAAQHKDELEAEAETMVLHDPLSPLGVSNIASFRDMLRKARGAGNTSGTFSVHMPHVRTSSSLPHLSLHQSVHSKLASASELDQLEASMRKALALSQSHGAADAGTDDEDEICVMCLLPLSESPEAEAPAADDADADADASGAVEGGSGSGEKQDEEEESKKPETPSADNKSFGVTPAGDDDADDVCVVQPCGHAYHTTCMFTFFSKCCVRECPMCRGPIDALEKKSTAEKWDRSMLNKMFKLPSVSMRFRQPLTAEPAAGEERPTPSFFTAPSQVRDLPHEEYKDAETGTRIRKVAVPPVVIELLDSDGNLQTEHDTVVVTVLHSSSAGTISPDSTVFKNGVAIFTDLSVGYSPDKARPNLVAIKFTAQAAGSVVNNKSLYVGVRVCPRVACGVVFVLHTHTRTHRQSRHK